MKQTTDIWFTSFLIEIKGYELSDYKITSRGRGKFFFNIDENTWQKLKLEFMRSDLSKIKQCHEKLKDLFY